jgi:hypothetical protein
MSWNRFQDTVVFLQGGWGDMKGSSLDRQHIWVLLQQGGGAGVGLRRTTNGGGSWFMDTFPVGISEILHDLYGHRFALGGGRLFRLDTELGVDPEEGPRTYTLEQNYPNPFNPVTTINYQLPTITRVTLKVYDVLGREVAALVNEVKQPGRHTVQWNASEVAGGVYFYRLSTRDFVQTRRLLLLR